MDAEFKLRKRSHSYLQGRRDAFEVAAATLRESRDCTTGLGPLIAVMDMYANAAITTMNRETDTRLKSERELCKVCRGNGSVKIPGGMKTCSVCEGNGFEPEAEPATRALSFGHKEYPKLKGGERNPSSEAGLRDALELLAQLWDEESLMSHDSAPSLCASQLRAALAKEARDAGAREADHWPEIYHTANGYKVQCECGWSSKSIKGVDPDEGLKVMWKEHVASSALAARDAAKETND